MAKFAKNLFTQKFQVANYFGRKIQHAWASPIRSFKLAKAKIKPPELIPKA
jgi:hypothetical protein